MASQGAIIIIRRVEVKREDLRLAEASALSEIDTQAAGKPLSVLQAIEACCILFRVLRRP